MNKVVVTLTGPSASGKSTLERMLCEDLRFKRVISTTTRQPRNGEIDGVDYRFITVDEFERMIAEGKFLECTKFSGNYYGAEEREFTNAFGEDKVPVIVVEPDGRGQMKTACRRLDWVLHDVFLTNPIRVRLERLCERFAHDVNFQPGGILRGISKSFAGRLWTVIYTEINWESDSPSYAGYYDNFTEVDRLAVWADIIEVALTKRRAAKKAA